MQVRCDGVAGCGIVAIRERGKRWFELQAEERTI